MENARCSRPCGDGRRRYPRRCPGHAQARRDRSIRLLREIAPIPLWCLKILVGNSGSYAHLTLADLEMLGNAPPDGVDFFIHSHRNEAIIERKPTGQAGPGEVPNLQLAGKAARARRSKGGSVIARSRARPSLAPNRFKDFWRE